MKNLLAFCVLFFSPFLFAEDITDFQIEEISIGDFVLTNGTLPAIILVDAVSRFVPGFLGDQKSLTEETFMNSLLAFPQYTRPAIFRGLCVPEVLLSGNHKAIEQWRKDQQFKKTTGLRPDLLENGDK